MAFPNSCRGLPSALAKVWDFFKFVFLDCGIRFKVPEKLRKIRIADDFKIPPRCFGRAHHMAKRHLKVSAKRRTDYYDMKSNLISIEPFDKVWFLNENRKEECATQFPSLILDQLVPILSS
jgi:hypothetical protein